MSFLVEKLTAPAVVLDDLGITLTGAIGTQHDLTDTPPNDLARSADLRAAMATELRVVDPRDAADTILLNQAESEEAVDNHNDTHFGIKGGRFDTLDDPNSTLTDGSFLRYDATGDVYEEILAGEIGTAIGRKEVARLATDGQDMTAGPFSGTYAAGGGAGGTGAFTTIDLTNAIDGVVPSLGDRIIVKDQGGGTSVQNGIYVVATAGAVGQLDRAPDHDEDAEVNANDYLFVSEGTSLADTSWFILTDNPITLNVTAITWSQATGSGSVTGGDGISVLGNVVTLDVDNLTTAVAALGDEIAFSDITDTNLTRKSTIQSVLNTLDVPYGITATGIIVRTGEDTYASRSIAVSGAGNEDGLAVTNGNGVAGDPTVGLDIVGLPALSDALAPGTDEIPIYNASVTANENITPNQILAAAVSTINSQPVPTFVDTTRSNKVLSMSDVSFTWGENVLGHNDWIRTAGNAHNALSGYIMPLQGTVVYVGAHCEDCNGNTKDLHLYIDGVDQGSIATLTGVGEDSDFNATLDLNFTQGQKLRLRSVGSGSGDIEDTVATVHVRWRA